VEWRRRTEFAELSEAECSLLDMSIEAKIVGDMALERARRLPSLSQVSTNPRSSAEL